MNTRCVVSSVLLCALSVFLAGWFPTGTHAASGGLDYSMAKGFVAAKDSTTLTLTADNKRLVVVATRATRILGRRDSFAAIVPNDVVRVEGRMAGSRLIADRVEVLLVAGGLQARRQSDELEIDLLIIDMSPR